MRFLSIPCLVLTILALVAVERTVHASIFSTQAASEASLAQPVDSYGSRRAAHPGHVPAHQPLPKGDMNSALCQILCAVAVSQLVLAVPDGINERPRHDEKIAVAGNVEPDQVTPSLQPTPPR